MGADRDGWIALSCTALHLYLHLHRTDGASQRQALWRLMFSACRCAAAVRRRPGNLASLAATLQRPSGGSSLFFWLFCGWEGRNGPEAVGSRLEDPPVPRPSPTPLLCLCLGP